MYEKEELSQRLTEETRRTTEKNVIVLTLSLNSWRVFGNIKKLS